MTINTTQPIISILIFLLVLTACDNFSEQAEDYESDRYEAEPYEPEVWSDSDDANQTYCQDMAWDGVRVGWCEDVIEVEAVEVPQPEKAH